MDASRAPEPSVAERSAAALAVLKSFLRAHPDSLARLRLSAGKTTSSEPQIALPAEALLLLSEVLEQLAQGKPAAVTPGTAELPVRAAAELLNVSDSYLEELLNEGALPCREIGSERRIRLDDLLAYKRRDLARRRQILSELTAEAQEMGLYD